MMTLEEEGAYVRLLCFCWQHGSIPADPEQIARLIGKGASTTLATTLQPMFKKSDDPDRLVHDRLDQERDKQAQWRAKSSAGGLKSAEKRKGGSTTLQPPLQGCFNHPTNQSPTLLSSSSKDSKESKKSLSRGTIEELKAFAIEIGLPSSDGESMYYHWESNGWKNGSSPVKDWKAGIRKWKSQGWLPSQKTGQLPIQRQSMAAIPPAPKKVQWADEL
jgi:uncharacterized protein YdaU (DUF1376 family)